MVVRNPNDGQAFALTIWLCRLLTLEARSAQRFSADIPQVSLKEIASQTGTLPNLSLKVVCRRTTFASCHRLRAGDITHSTGKCDDTNRC